MYRVIDSRGSGKTSRLMLLAKESGATIVCSNPHAMRQKAECYGLVGIDFISYKEYTECLLKNDDREFLIDELESFIKRCFGGKLIGYTLSEDD